MNKNFGRNLFVYALAAVVLLALFNQFQGGSSRAGVDVLKYSDFKAEVQKENSRAIRFYEKYGFVFSPEDSARLTTSIMLTKPVEQHG